MKSFPLLSLTPEILAEICEDLSPKDLYTLTIVCKKLRNFLWATSGCTQQIWRRSRLLMFSLDSLLPPKGMCEQQYIWLKELGSTCQVCRAQVDKSERCLIWEFKRLCCRPCLSIKTTSLEDLRNNIPEEVLSCLPNVNDIKPSNFFEACLVTLPGSRYQNPYYWTTDVYKAYREYHALNANEREKWVEKKKAEVEEFNQSIEELKSKDMTEFLTSLMRYTMTQAN
ncbi:950_t:CDS:2 [Cetraspora pellucida]|uniref:950_t:CDS:1 n=1 Tax=Cetraspora pellucida TaxID=1433469 RepID=A0ACA9JZH4_9GLOM|nr:950_t:CDS:2 [Cetraspora pellucida]